MVFDWLTKSILIFALQSNGENLELGDYFVIELSKISFQNKMIGIGQVVASWFDKHRTFFIQLLWNILFLYELVSSRPPVIENSSYGDLSYQRQLENNPLRNPF